MDSVSPGQPEPAYRPITLQVTTTRTEDTPSKCNGASPTACRLGGKWFLGVRICKCRQMLSTVLDLPHCSRKSGIIPSLLPHLNPQFQHHRERGNTGHFKSHCNWETIFPRKLLSLMLYQYTRDTAALAAKLHSLAQKSQMSNISDSMAIHSKWERGCLKYTKEKKTIQRLCGVPLSQTHYNFKCTHTLFKDCKTPLLGLRGNTTVRSASGSTPAQRRNARLEQA